jgi:hypothetical protein
MPVEVKLEGRVLAVIYCDANRKPMGWGHGWADAAVDPAAIARLRWGPYLGVATGAINGIVVVDVDPRNGGDQTFAEHLSWLPETRTHQSRRGGRHLIYKYPAQGIRTFTGTEGRWPGIDILSDNPQKGVVWPQSSPGYSVIDDRPMVECPARLCELREGMGVIHQEQEPDDEGFTPIPPPFEKPIQYEINYAIKALDNACVELRDCPGGYRNHLLNVLAYKMGRLVVRGWIQRHWVEDYLLGACKANGLLDEDGKNQCAATIRSGIEAGMQRPYHDIRWRVSNQ